MKNKIKLSIPKPCNENWLEMTPTENGRFCSTCNKTVRDFTKSSDREIVLAYNENPKQCGRFQRFQLNRDLIIPKEKKSIWMIFAASIISFLGLGNQHAKSQGNVKIEQRGNKILNDSAKINSDSEIKEYNGIIYDSEKIPLPGVSIHIKGSKTGTGTNFDGAFSIQAKKNDILIFSFLGFENIEFKTQDNTNICVMMKEEVQDSRVIIMGYPNMGKREDEYIEF